MKNTSEGSILIISLWMLVIFSIFAVGLYRIVSSQIRITQRLEHFILSEYAARSICLSTKSYLDSDQTDYDTLYELSRQRNGQLGLLSYTYIFEDQAGKININSIPSVVLARLPGLNEDIADAITKSSLRPFHIKEELLLLDEVNQELFSQFSQYITAHSRGTININTAPSKVLAALGLEDSLVDIIIAFRAGADGREATEDDGIFETKSGILETLRSFTGLLLTQQQQLLAAMQFLDVKGEVLSVKINTEVLGKKAMEYDIITNGEKVFQWRER